MTAEPDAWTQLYDLVERFTKEIEVRPDLVVEGVAYERSVRFTLIETDHSKGSHEKGRYRYHSTQRNVGTMRELAQALLDACDFVEASNPEWASLKPGTGPERVER